MSTTEEAKVNVDVPIIPSDSEIRKEMEVLMQSVDLGTTSTRQFISKLSTKFNGADLSTGKKKYIKATIVEIIDSIKEEEEEEEFNQVFRENTGISDYCFDDIFEIKNNQSHMHEFALQDGETNQFTQRTWTLLGRYIANNTHLGSLRSTQLRNITDEMMAFLFGELVSSASLQKLEVCRNRIGIDGVRCMLPFLQNSPNLSALNFRLSSTINTECFEVVVSALHNSKSEGIGLCRLQHSRYFGIRETQPSKPY